MEGRHPPVGIRGLPWLARLREAVAFVADSHDSFGGPPEAEVRERPVDCRGGLGSGGAQILRSGVVCRQHEDNAPGSAGPRKGAVDEVADVVGQVPVGAGDDDLGGVVGVTGPGDITQYPPTQGFSAVAGHDVGGIFGVAG
jgi:hypothetical protein